MLGDYILEKARESRNSKKVDLKIEIERLREELHYLIDSGEVVNETILMKSRELDIIILEYYLMK
jgi:hypothetical protein